MNPTRRLSSRTSILSGNISSLLALGALALASAPLASHAANIIWDGNGVGGTDIGVAANWLGDVLPSVAVPDTMVFDGTVAGPLVLLYNDASLAGAAGNGGLNLNMTGTQTSSLSIDSGANVNSLRLNNVTLDAGAGAFSLGDGSGTFNVTLGGAGGQTHTFTNNSSNTAIIGSDVVFGTGGAGAHTLVLAGSGNWTLNNIITNSSGTVTVTKNDNGILTLNGANTYTGGTNLNAGTLNINSTAALGTGALTINGGTIDNTSAGALVLTATLAQNWNGDFTFAGTRDLTFGATGLGNTNLGGIGSVRQVTTNAGTLTIGTMSGVGYGLTKAGAGTLQLSTTSNATANNITGVLNVVGGKFAIGARDFKAGGLTGSAIVENDSATTRWIFINNNADNVFSGTLQNGTAAGLLGFYKAGTGTLTLTGTNTYTSTTSIGGGTLEFGSATTAGLTETLSTSTNSGLVFDRGDGTVKSSFNGTGTQAITFGSRLLRTAGATGNFVTAGGTNGADNKIVLTQAAGFINQGMYFGGDNYAWMDGTNTFVRPMAYGSDAGAVTSGTAASLASATHQEFTGDITAQGAATFTTLKDTGNNAFTLAAGATVTTNGILKAGNVAGGAIISGGTGLQAASGAELVIRTAGANDALNIATPILANGTNILTTSGNGALTLSAANTYTGMTNVNGKTLNLSGSILTGGLNVFGGATVNLTGSIDNANAASGVVTVGFAPTGSAQSGNAVLNISGSGTVKANVANGLTLANGPYTNGFLNMTGGSIVTSDQIHLGLGTGLAGSNPYAAFTMSGGTVASGSWLVVAANNDRAVLNQSGGAITVNTNRMTIGAGGAASIGVVNLSGGTFDDAVGVFVGENGTGILNVSNTGTLRLGTTGTLQFGGNATSLAGTVNLLGGSISAGQVTRVTSTGVYLFNFNGGTLKAAQSSATFFASLANTTAYVYGGGGTVDNNGNAITIGQPLLAPTGNGIYGAGAITGGSGYLDTPVVTILRGAGDTTGVGATAVANVSGGVVTGITITNPGTGYTATPTFVLYGGGYSTPATVTGVAPTANTGGGMIFTGAGNTTLTGQNAGSYSGGTTVNNGTLTLTGANNGVGIIRGTLNINPGATVVTTSANAFGYNVGARVETVNLNGGILNTTATGDSAWTTTFNLTGGTLTSNGGTSSTAAPSYWVLGRDNAGAAATGINSLASATTSTVAGRLQLRPDNGNTAVIFNVADGAAATDLLVSAAVTETGPVAVNKIGAGRLEMSGTNTYSGATNVANGTLLLSGNGSINSSSGITVNGANAKLIQTSFTSVNPTVTLTSGTVDGVGQINTLNATAGTIANGNGTTGSLILGALTINGPISLNLSTASNAAVLNTTTLTTNGNTITVNATNASWMNGQSYDLVSYATLNGTLANFVKGTIANLGARQSATLADSGFAISLAIAGDQPLWTGKQNGKWTTATIGGQSNWRLQNNGTPTDFLTNDTVLFDDSVTGTTTVNISDANVNPISTTFDHNSVNYTLTSTGGFGIASGTLIKNGGGTLTIANANTYTGATTLNGGTLNISGSLGNTPVAVAFGTNLNLQAANAITQNVVTVDGTFSETVANGLGGTAKLVLNTDTTLTRANAHSGGTSLTFGTFAINNGAAIGTGTLTLSNVTLDNTSGAPVTFTNNNAQTWLANTVLTFAGTNSLDFGTGTISLGTDAGAGNFQLTNNSALAGTALTIGGTITGGSTGAGGAKILTVDGPGGTVISGSIVKSAAASLTVNDNVAAKLTLSGTASNFTTLNINGGASSIVELGAGNMTLANGGGNILQSTTGGTINGTGGGAIVLGSNGGDFGTTGGTTLTMNARLLGTNGVDFWNANGGFDLGTIILTAANDYTGTTNVENTRVILPAGASINASNTANVGQITVSDVANIPAVLNITGGTVNATKNTSPSFAVGSVANSIGSVTMSSGTINTTSEFHLGRGAGSYAGFKMTGGTVNSGNWLVVGFNNDRSILTQTGGTINIAANRMTLGAGGGGAIGDVLLSGGVFNVAAGANTGVFVGENGTGSLTMTGNAALNLSTTGAAASGTLQFGNANTSLAGVFNLNGGTATVFGVTKGASTATANYQFNFNGGTLKANATNGLFFASLANTSAYVRSGGAVIDDGGFAITVAQPLLAPTGNGVSSISVSGGTGYLGAPLVLITGDGTGATALANVDDSGNLTGITITSPGVGYTTASASLVGGNGTGAIVNGVNLATNTSGGFTKKGNGVLTLAGANTYTGPTVVNSGTLAVTGSLSGSVFVNVKSGATLDVSGAAGGFALSPGQTLGGDGTVAGAVTMTIGSVLAPGQSAGTLTFTGNLGIGPAVALSGSAALQFELGSLSDKVLLTTGTLDIGTGSLAFDDFAFTATAGFGNGTYTLFDTNTTILGSLDASPVNLTGTIGGQTATLAFGDNGHDIVLNVVPEPGTCTALLGGLAMILGTRRRRK